MAMLSNKTSFDSNIEALRGFAAVCVVFHHLDVFKNILDPLASFSLIGNYTPPGHLSVLVFFMISGYVMGLTNKNHFSIEESKFYLKKRFVRLYPIYFLTILITFWIVPDQKIINVLGQLAFSQLTVFEVMKGNPALWSLNFEVIYYLLFIAILFFKPNSKFLLFFAFIFGISSFLVEGFPPLLSAYSIGLIYWAIGLYIAWNCDKGEEGYFCQLKISLLLLMFSVSDLNPFNLLLNYLDFNDKFTFNYPAYLVSFKDLAFLPFCIFILLVFANRKSKYFKPLLLMTYLLPISMLLYFIVKGEFTHFSFLFIPAFFLLISLVTLVTPFKQKKIVFFVSEVLVKLGSISYGIYLIHCPVIYALGKVEIFKGTIIGFVFKSFFFLFFTFLLSVILENIIQPLAKKYLYESFFPAISKVKVFLKVKNLNLKKTLIKVKSFEYLKERSLQAYKK